MKFNPNQLSLDPTVMQSKTVANIVEILSHAVDSNNLETMIRLSNHIIEQRDKSETLYSKRSKGGTRSKPNMSEEARKMANKLLGGF
jgi:hypothetical protein|tara:strand:+ start:8184 stop:8444 length:261 start_codon:yes stop_codon:yes gene_type:complete